MPSDISVTQHYQHPDLIHAITDALEKQGKSKDALETKDLAAVDEFHIGGLGATEHFLGNLDLHSQSKVLDLGCGIGGAARHCAQHYQCDVSAIDLTASYIEAAKELTDWVKLTDKISFHQASALSIPFADQQFDCCYMMHLGMNIADKTALFSEAARVLKTEGRIAIYDILTVGQGPLTYPLPWASDSQSSHIATLEVYREALNQAGFDIETVNNRQDFARSFYQTLAKKNRQSPLGLHILMQNNAPQKLANMVDALQDRVIAPVEFYARKR